MVTEALSSEETTVEAAITAVSGLSSYFSAVVALAPPDGTWRKRSFQNLMHPVCTVSCIGLV